jgi:hypothetical protein
MMIPNSEDTTGFLILCDGIVGVAERSPVCPAQYGENFSDLGSVFSRQQNQPQSRGDQVNTNLSLLSWISMMLLCVLQPWSLEV